MNFLEKRILQEATVAPGIVLKVDSFLKHQVNAAGAAIVGIKKLCGGWLAYPQLWLLTGSLTVVEYMNRKTGKIRFKVEEYE